MARIPGRCHAAAAAATPHTRMTKFDPLLSTMSESDDRVDPLPEAAAPIVDDTSLVVFGEVGPGRIGWSADTSTDGDEAESLWREHSSMLLRFATVLVGPSDAHDVATEAFLTASERLLAGDVDHPTSFLYRAVSNRAHDLRRSRERRWRRDLHAIGPATAHDPDPLVDVRRAVSSLSLAQRSVVYLVYWEDRTERDAAAILGIAPGTVRRHLVRARIHLAKALR